MEYCGFNDAHQTVQSIYCSSHLLFTYNRVQKVFSLIFSIAWKYKDSCSHSLCMMGNVACLSSVIFLLFVYLFVCLFVCLFVVVFQIISLVCQMVRIQFQQFQSISLHVKHVKSKKKRDLFSDSWGKWEVRAAAF